MPPRHHRIGELHLYVVASTKDYRILQPDGINGDASKEHAPFAFLNRGLLLNLYWLPKGEYDRPERNSVTDPEQRRFLNRDLIDDGPQLAAQILDDPARPVTGDPAMPPGDLRMRQNKVRVCGTADNEVVRLNPVTARRQPC